MSNTCWVLTTEYNDHDQNGQYLVAVFKDKPTKLELHGALCLKDIKLYIETFNYDKVKNKFIKDLSIKPINVYQHLLENGGGRISIEHQWYHLKEINFGTLYQ